MLLVQGSAVSDNADSKDSAQYPAVHFTKTYGQAISYYATPSPILSLVEYLHDIWKRARNPYQNLDFLPD